MTIHVAKAMCEQHHEKKFASLNYVIANYVTARFCKWEMHDMNVAVQKDNQDVGIPGNFAVQEGSFLNTCISYSCY